MDANQISEVILMTQSVAAIQPGLVHDKLPRANWARSLNGALRELRSSISTGTVVSGLLLLGISVGLTLGIFIYWDVLEAMGPWGYPGVFAAELISSASIFIPLPAHNYAMAMAVTLDPYLLGLAGGVGAGLGELTGYLLGKYGKKGVEGGRWFARFEAMAKKRFGLAIFIFAFMPAPIDFVGILAGAAGYPIWRFAAIVSLGKVLKITLLTVAASIGLPVVFDFFS